MPSINTTMLDHHSPAVFHFLHLHSTCMYFRAIIAIQGVSLILSTHHLFPLLLSHHNIHCFAKSVR